MSQCRVICPYCLGHAKRISGQELYGPEFKPKGRWFYACMPCMAWVGTHQNSGKPLGHLANAPLRAMRRIVHDEFDPLWKQGHMSRREAYARLAKALDLYRGNCHIAMFDMETCDRALQAIRNEWKEINEKEEIST